MKKEEEVMDDKKRRRFESHPPGTDGDGGEGGGTFLQLKVVRQILGLLKPEEVQEILAKAAAQNPEVGRMVCDAVGAERQNRKLFVRGLDSETTAEDVRQAFVPFGEIVEHVVIKDKATGKSKGFGFVTFADMESTLRALEEPSKLIDGRMSMCQLAVLGNKSPQADILPRKIFIGNVHSDLSAERLLDFFSQFGEIDEGPIGFDRTTNKSKGYALFVYKTVESANRALEEANKLIDGHQVFCKLAGDPKNKLASSQQQHQQQHQQQQDPRQQQYQSDTHYILQQGAGGSQHALLQYPQGIPQAQGHSPLLPTAQQAYALPLNGAWPSAIPQQYSYPSPAAGTPGGYLASSQTQQVMAGAGGGGGGAGRGASSMQQAAGAAGYVLAVPPGPSGYTLPGYGLPQAGSTTHQGGAAGGAGGGAGGGTTLATLQQMQQQQASQHLGARTAGAPGAPGGAAAGAGLFQAQYGSAGGGPGGGALQYQSGGLAGVYPGGSGAGVQPGGAYYGRQ